MNFHELIHQRDGLLRQARLANVAFACQRLGVYAARIARARLHGLVRLNPGDPAGEQPWPGLTALEGSQAVLEEHFLDEEGVERADILGFLGEEVGAGGCTFRLEELEGRFLVPLQRELGAAGIPPPGAAPRIGGPNRGRG
jgi:hypothetical protein